MCQNETHRRRAALNERVTEISEAMSGVTAEDISIATRKSRDEDAV